VSTAGHCVNEGPGDFATNWAFVPAYNNGSAPFGTWNRTHPRHHRPLGQQR
jgi:V8-like Glu-specific endopeptidase